MANYVLSPAGVAGADFTTSRFPSGDLLPGENCMIRVTSTSNFGVTDPYDEIAFVTDFGDTGATYTVGGGGRTNDANSLRGWNTVHAWPTAGSKTVTITGRTLAGVTKQKTVPITVMDPDVDITWDNDIYVSFAGDFTGAPAVGGGVQHISTITALLAFAPTAGENTRITFRRGETYTWQQAAGGVPLKAGNITYIQGDTWGTGNPAKIVAGSTLNDSTLTRVFDGGYGTFAPRIVAVGIEFDGLYDPTTGISAAGRMVPFYAINYTTGGGGSFSLHKVTSSGCFDTIEIGGGGTYADPQAWLLVSDSHISNWENYGIFGGWSNIGVVGSSLKQHPRAILRPDAKTSLPQAPDHGPVRVSAAFACVSNNTLASTSGWSTGGGIPTGSTPESEGVPQQCLRLVAARYNADAIFSVHENVSYAGGLVGVGEGPPLTLTLYGMRAMIEGNEHNQIRYWGAVVVGKMAGVYVHNNIVYQPDIFSLANFHGLLLMEDPVSTGTISSEATTNPITVRNNTVFSHGSVSGVEAQNVRLVDTTYTGWTGATPVITGNIMEIPNHPNQSDFTNYTLISAGDRFKPVTGSTAIDAVTSGLVPVYDIDGNTRSLPANAGAHDTSVASASTVSAPSNSVVPTFAVLSSFADEYAATSFGTWTNWTGDQEYLVEYQWNLDAVPDVKSTVFDGAAKTGSLTLEIIATNRGGTRISATSPGMAI